jgi:predicted RNA-binding protein YlxR (DUF448 family)
VGCGAIRPKRTLVRLALQEDRVVRDDRAVRQGRGAYVCDAACFDKAVATRALPRAFRRSVRTDGNTLESLDD